MKLLLSQIKRSLLLQKPLVDLVSITISSPSLFGIYQNGKLIKLIKKEGKTSEVLPSVFDEISKNYNIRKIIYTRGPGSYMAIKLSYVFFKSIEITKGIKLLGADGFEFNQNKPIKAVGKSFFVKRDGIITLEKDLKAGEFSLPESLEQIDFSDDTSPLYILSPV